MAERLKMLIVHNCDNLSNARRSTLDFLYSFERYSPNQDYLYHRIMLPVTPEIRDTDWDAIIFDSTACGIVTLRPRERFARIRDEWRFLRGSRAVKFVFPQDDASHGAIMDLWFNWMEVDALYTVRPEKVELIYPITKQRAEIIPTLAGFLDDTMIENAARFRKPFADREWVVGQRVTQYPAWGGRFARRKGEAALRMKDECERRGVKCNISTDPKDVLLGDSWTRFLGDTQFVIGSEGGHGLWDPYGTIQDSVNAYLSAHPNATFEETEEACFLGLDGANCFPGFAPRILEAALAGCGQVLVKGQYRGLLRENVHYISLREDFGNFDEVFAAMQDTRRVACMIEATQRAIVDNSRFRYRTFVADVFSNISQIRKSKRANLPARKLSSAAGRWMDFQLMHFNSLRAALAVFGVERERLQEPYLTAWIERELGGQVTDPDMRSALHLPEEVETLAAATNGARTYVATEQTRSAVILHSVEAILKVDGACDALLALVGPSSCDPRRNHKIRENAETQRPELLQLALDTITALEATEAIWLRTSVELGSKSTLPDNLRAQAPAHRAEIMRLGLRVLDSLSGASEAIVDLAQNASPDREHIATARTHQSQWIQRRGPEDRSIAVLKLHLLAALGLISASEDQNAPPAKSAEDLFDLLIAKTEALKDPATAAMLYSVLQSATSSTIRGPLIRLIAKARLDGIRGRLANAFSSPLD